MLSLTNETVVLTGALFGSVYLFAKSLKNINNVLTRCYKPQQKQRIFYLLLINGVTLAFSFFTFSFSSVLHPFTLNYFRATRINYLF